jgi:hypothetical protein
MDNKYKFSIYFSLSILIILFYLTFLVISTPKVDSNLPNLEQDLIIDSNPNTETILEQEPKQIIYTYEEALISGDVSNCILIKDIDKQNICTSKLGSCDTDDCIYSKALDSSNQNDCYEIQDENLKLKCSYETFKTKIFDSSVLENDITLCDKIEEEILNQRCKDNFYFVGSINSNDITLCDNIIQSDLKEACYNE